MLTKETLQRIKRSDWAVWSELLETPKSAKTHFCSTLLKTLKNHSDLVGIQKIELYFQTYLTNCIERIESSEKEDPKWTLTPEEILKSKKPKSLAHVSKITSLPIFSEQGTYGYLWITSQRKLSSKKLESLEALFQFLASLAGNEIVKTRQVKPDRFWCELTGNFSELPLKAEKMNQVIFEEKLNEWVQLLTGGAQLVEVTTELEEMPLALYSVLAPQLARFYRSTRQGILSPRFHMTLKKTETGFAFFWNEMDSRLLDTEALLPIQTTLEHYGFKLELNASKPVLHLPNVDSQLG